MSNNPLGIRLAFEQKNGNVRAIGEHADGKISLFLLSPDQVAKIQKNEHIPDLTAELTFEVDQAVEAAHLTLTNQREALSGVTGASRMMAALLMVLSHEKLADPKATGDGDVSDI
ncbi:MAG: hypothetical protein AAF478_03580 [Pseudomonadota bacterium]